MTAQRRIGMVGVGRMGHGIAASLARHGHRVDFLEHPGNQPVDDLLAGGSRALGTAAELASGADIVILCVTGTPEVEDALFRPDGVMAGLKPGATVVDCSTAIPSSTRAIAARVAEAGGRFMDAAMTRTPKEAAEGRIGLIVGAAPDLFEEVLPVLRCFAEDIRHAGPPGAGHQVKLLHNFVSLGFSAVLAEAAAAAGRGGVDPATLVEVLEAGGGRGVVLDRFKPFLLAGDASGFRFSLANARKDMTYYATMAAELGGGTAVAVAVRDLYEQANRDGHGERAVPELAGLLADRP